MTFKKSATTPILIATLGMFFFSMMDAVMKAQALGLGTYNAVFWRMLLGAVFASLLYFPSGPQWPNLRALKIHLTRGTVAAVMAYLFFFGLTRVPLAQAIGLSFIAPIIALVLVAPLLGEQVGPNCKFAAFLGFAGVLVVLSGELSASVSDIDLMGALSILTSAVFYAFNLVLQRMQALIASPLEITFYQNSIVFLLLLLGAPFLAVLPDKAMLWGGSALAAALAILSLVLMSAAYRQAEAKRLLVIEYTAFIWAAALGWIFFSESLSGNTIAGTFLIVLGCFISARDK